MNKEELQIRDREKAEHPLTLIFRFFHTLTNRCLRPLFIESAEVTVITAVTDYCKCGEVQRHSSTERPKTIGKF